MFPISKYQREHIKDREVSYSPWQELFDDDQPTHPPSFHRDITFVHPLNNAVGPSEAKTFRQQKYQRFGQYGICVENTTKIQGVPGADCFRVEDRWILESSSTSSEEPTVTLSVSFQLVFHKRTMFKPIIQKNSKAETKKWFAGFVKYMNDAIREGASGGKSDTLAPPPALTLSDSEAEPKLETTTGSTRYHVSVPWLVVVGVALALLLLSVQLWQLQRSVDLLHEQLRLLQTRDEQLQRLLNKDL